MSVVEMPMSTSAATMTRLRPTRSPMCPARIPPMGRATKPTANVAKAAIVAASGSVTGKNSLPITSEAATE